MPRWPSCSQPAPARRPPTSALPACSQPAKAPEPRSSCCRRLVAGGRQAPAGPHGWSQRGGHCRHDRPGRGLGAPSSRAARVAAAASKVGLDFPEPSQRIIASPPSTVAQPELAPLVVSLPPLNAPGHRGARHYRVTGREPPPWRRRPHQGPRPPRSLLLSRPRSTWRRRRPWRRRLPRLRPPGPRPRLHRRRRPCRRARRRSCGPRCHPRSTPSVRPSWRTSAVCATPIEIPSSCGPASSPTPPTSACPAGPGTSPGPEAVSRSRQRRRHPRRSEVRPLRRRGWR